MRYKLPLYYKGYAASTELENDIITCTCLPLNWHVRIPLSQIFSLDTRFKSVVDQYLEDCKSDYVTPDTQSIFEKANLGYYSGSLADEFEKDVETYFGFSDLDSETKRIIHEIAWQRGHASGYVEVLNQYDDLVRLALTATGNK